MLRSGTGKDLKTIFEQKEIIRKSILSPFLFNVYLHELDKFIVKLQAKAAITYKEYVNGLYGNIEAKINYKKISHEFSTEK